METTTLYIGNSNQILTCCCPPAPIMILDRRIWPGNVQGTRVNPEWQWRRNPPCTGHAHNPRVIWACAMCTQCTPCTRWRRAGAFPIVLFWWRAASIAMHTWNVPHMKWIDKENKKKYVPPSNRPGIWVNVPALAKPFFTRTVLMDHTLLLPLKPGCTSTLWKMPTQNFLIILMVLILPLRRRALTTVL